VLSYYVSLRSEFHLICVYLRLMMSNTYCVVILFVCVLCCHFLWIVHFVIVPSVFYDVYLIGIVNHINASHLIDIVMS